MMKATVLPQMVAIMIAATLALWLDAPVTLPAEAATVGGDHDV